MFDKYLKKENLKPEHMLDAYNYLKEYAAENNTTVKKILGDKENIPVAAEYIHAKLPWLTRKVLGKEKIESLITDNFDFIKEQAMALEKEQNADKTKVAKSEDVEKPKKSKKA